MCIRDSRYGDRGGKNYSREERPYGDREKRYDRRDRRDDRPRATGLPRSKRQPYFGTFLGNSNDIKKTDAPDDNKTEE